MTPGGTPKGTPQGDEEPPERKRLGLSRPGTLVGFGLAGLVLGWAMRPLTLQLGEGEPGLGWTPVLLIGFAAAALWVIAWITRRALARPHGLEPHKAVSRMVLGKASALVGAALLGYYTGRAIGQLGIAAELAGQRLLHAVLAAVCGAAMMAGALALERACLVRSGDDDDLP